MILRKLHNHESGFTLVELTLVIFLMGVLAFSAVPNDPGSQLLNLDSAVRKLRGDLRYAQNLAITTGEGHGVRMTGPTTYEVYNIVSGDIVDSPYDHNPMQLDLAEDYMGVTFNVADQNLDIVFNAYGEPVTGGGEVIELATGADNKQIQISQTSGFVSIL